jgi:hypothetical protein
MADQVVAIVAIVVSGVVGPGLAVLGARQRQRDDHRAQAREELQSVLDEGAKALGRGKRAYERIYAADRDGVLADTCRDAFDERREAMRAVRYAQDRIALRTGSDSDVHRAYEACVGTLDKQRHFARSFERSGADRNKIEPSSRPEQARGHAEFEPARERYIAVALRHIAQRF